MRIKVLLIGLLAPFVMAAEPLVPFDRTQGHTGSEAILAFIGEEIFTREAPETVAEPEFDIATGRDTVFIRMDSEWQSRFSIIDIMRGDYEGDTIDFTAFDHFGQPRYSKSKGPILIYLHDIDAGWFHDKYNFAKVHPTKGGGWAVCGSFFRDHDGERVPNPKPRPVEFDPPVIIDVANEYLDLDVELAEYAKDDVTLSPSELAEITQEVSDHNDSVDQKYVTPIYTRVDNKARCEYGLPVDVVISHEFETNFRPQMIYDHCRAQHPGFNKMDDKARQQDAQRPVKICESTLLASDWPYAD